MNDIRQRILTIIEQLPDEKLATFLYLALFFKTGKESVQPMLVSQAYMEDKFDFHNCGNDDALSFGNPILKIEKLKETVNTILNENALGYTLNNLLRKQKLDIIDVSCNQPPKKWSYEEWFGEGIDCEVLRVGANGWKKGKIKLKLNVTIEFCPDEPEFEETPENNESETSKPESPLDDLRRQLLNQENSPS